jgi:hypothetical protein
VLNSGPFSRVRGGRNSVLQIESFPTHEQPHDKRTKAFDIAHTGATTCDQIVCQRAHFESQTGSNKSKGIIKAASPQSAEGISTDGRKKSFKQANIGTGEKESSQSTKVRPEGCTSASSRT